MELSNKAYTNADYGGAVIDRRLTFGYCTFICGILVTWGNKKQNVIARSSVEAKFTTMTLRICQLL